MAKPIKETPILTGKDASVFVKNISSNKGKVISGDEAKRINTNYQKFIEVTTKK